MAFVKRSYGEITESILSQITKGIVNEKHEYASNRTKYRLGHPDYGSRLHELIGEPNNERTRELVRLYAKECISQEPRV